MKKSFYISVAMAVVAMSGWSLPAGADDVMFRHKTKIGKEEVLRVDHTQVPELKKAAKESKPLSRFRVQKRDPAGDPEPQDGFAVRFAVVENEEGPEGTYYEPWKVYVCKGDGAYGRSYYNYSYYPDEETLAQGYAWGCYVPEGEYTIILCSDLRRRAAEGEEMDPYITNSYVVKENVRIDGDVTITFRQSEAKNCITARLILPDGSEVPDPYLRDESGAIIGERDDVSVRSSRSFINVNGDYSLNLGMDYEEGRQDYVYINDISSNWVYALNMAAVNAEGVYASCVTKRGPITSSMDFRNDPANYSKTSVKFNPDLPGVNKECKGFGVSTQLAWKGADWTTGAEGMIVNKLGISDEIPVYIDAEASDLVSPDAVDLITTVLVAKDVTKITATDENGDPVLDENGNPFVYYEASYMTSPGIFHEKGDKYLCIDNYGYDIEDYPEESFLLPYDEVFAYQKNEQTEFFSGVPVMSLMADSFITEDYSRFGVYPQFYYPCLSSFELPYTFTASYNGDTFVENGSPADFAWEEWSLENYKAPGVFDISVSSSWNPADDKAVLENKLHIDTSKEDFNAPKVERWQLRGSDGTLVSKASKESSVYFMCMEDSDPGFKIEVKAKELPEAVLNAEKIREQPFYENGIWQIRQVYKIDMKDFPGEDGKKYSLVFNLADASGNTGEQTIGNAFEWSGASGVNGVGAEADIYIENGQLHAPAGSEVYSIDGVRVGESNLPKGIYIVRSGVRSVKVLAK